jgi:hypothetical protein
MPNYSLNIDISATDLPTILKAGQQVTIVKQPNGPSSLMVAWVAFGPLENNTVAWTENYALYASESQIQAGATIAMMTDSPATPGQQYVLTQGGVFAPPTPVQLPPNTYAVLNQFGTNPESLTFGLAQTIQVNGTASPDNPIGAMQVLNEETGQFTPLETISVFLQANVSTSMFIGSVTSQPLSLTYGQVSSYTVAWDAAIGQFVVQSSSKAAVPARRPGGAQPQPAAR